MISVITLFVYLTSARDTGSTGPTCRSSDCRYSAIKQRDIDENRLAPYQRTLFLLVENGNESKWNTTTNSKYNASKGRYHLL